MLQLSSRIILLANSYLIKPLFLALSLAGLVTTSLQQQAIPGDEYDENYESLVQKIAAPKAMSPQNKSYEKSI